MESKASLQQIQAMSYEVLLKSDNCKLIDTRRTFEFNGWDGGHIEGAYNIDAHWVINDEQMLEIISDRELSINDNIILYGNT